MSGVEALEQTTTPPPAEVTTEPVNMDTELDGIWDRAFVTNGADRGDGGKFTSPNGEPETPEAEPATPSLEGEKGEEQPGSTPVDVPLPPNWNGKAELADAWNAIPADKRAIIAEHQQELHSRLSNMGRDVATYKPLQEAASEFAEYFNGNLKGSDGQPISPADGVRYLANIQRMMDRNPRETILSIIDTYGLKEELAKVFGGQVQQVPQDQKILLDKIAGLERTIQGLRDPANIEQVLEKRELQTEISRFAQSKPLYAHVEADLPFFISKAKTQLGEGASRTAILDRAYDLAVQADPALRAQTEAAKAAEVVDSAKAEAAKRATGVNVTSTSSGKARQPTIDDELSAIWDKSRKS